MAEQKKTSALRRYISYGTGFLGDALYYQFITSYLLVFLTGPVGLGSKDAGTVGSIIVLADAICSLFVGRVTDGLKCKYGRRRPVLLFSAFVLPNCVGALVITTCLQIPSAIFLESFLSFLGLGVSAPMASLGSLCSDALATITLYPYRLICPAIILTVIVLTLNLVGDGLRDALDPRLKK